MVRGVKASRSSLQISQWTLCCAMKETRPLTPRMPAAHIGQSWPSVQEEWGLFVQSLQAHSRPVQSSKVSHPNPKWNDRELSEYLKGHVHCIQARLPNICPDVTKQKAAALLQRSSVNRTLHICLQIWTWPTVAFKGKYLPFSLLLVYLSSLLSTTITIHAFRGTE